MASPQRPQPPHYVLVRHSNALLQPSIQYQYSDDSPLAMLQQPGEQVLVLDAYAPHSQPVALSLSPSLAVAHIKVDDAPAADDGAHMYVLETISSPERPVDASNIVERRPPNVLLSQFKDRNSVLRRALEYPGCET
uniref:Uncharacterized protein n=1 Tax=Mycena chlorophos TaxID=658473 RepID=A0ABQ0LF80_MYCCL|nr:predicted protein [Mycena chlorophos]